MSTKSHKIEVRLEAHAKINLTLEVLGRRSDGYHEVRTIFQSINLKDVLYFQHAPQLELECSEPDLDDDENLVLTAARALQTATGCSEGARIRLKKKIPVTMGLGGGSSDAAATLVALDALWGLGLGLEGLQSIAKDLGSDVPFFLWGGTALGERRGEVVTSLPALPVRWVVLLCPSIQLRDKTTRLYSMLTDDSFTDGSRTQGAIGCIKIGKLNDGLLYNVFEDVASAAYGDFRQNWQDFIEAGAERPHLAGAGPALFNFVGEKAEGEAISRALQERGYMTYLVTTEGHRSVQSTSGKGAME